MIGFNPRHRPATLVATAIILVIAPPVAAQEVEPLPLTQIGLERLEHRFEAINTRVDADRVADPDRLTPAQTTRLDSIVSEVAGTLDAMAKKRARPGDASRLKLALTGYGDFLRGMYDPMPPEIAAPWKAITLSFLAALRADLAEYDRRFFIRNGSDSERLNILESLLVQAFQRAPTGGTIRYPGAIEPIARVQLFGYQYSLEGDELTPASPVFQLGLTRYLYGTSTLAKRLNHVGLAAAYQRDHVNDVDLGGAVLHLAAWDIGVFCNVDDCAEPTFMASKSLSFFEPLWNGAREAIAGFE